MQQKILVVGGAGYVGCVLVRELLERGHAVRILDRLYYGSEGLEDVRDRIELIQADMRRLPEGLFHQISAVINLGGLSNDPTAEYNPEANYEMNTVAVDLRVNSPMFGKWFGTELTAENKKQLYVLIGFAHGFVTLSDVAEVQYKQTGFYTPSSEGTLLWNDTEVGVEWPIKEPTLSKRDQNGMSLREYLTNPAFK